MHSRIYQISTEPVKLEDYLCESDFSEHWFIGSIADYVDRDVDRDADIKNLREHLVNVALFDTVDSFVILPSGKETYFADAYAAFTAARDKTISMGLSEFASVGFSAPVYSMKNAFCDKFALYVSSDEFNTIPFDEFIRCADSGCRYYIGGTLDYHY